MAAPFGMSAASHSRAQAGKANQRSFPAGARPPSRQRSTVLDGAGKAIFQCPTSLHAAPLLRVGLRMSVGLALSSRRSSDILPSKTRDLVTVDDLFELRD